MEFITRNEGENAKKIHSPVFLLSEYCMLPLLAKSLSIALIEVKTVPIGQFSTT